MSESDEGTFHGYGSLTASIDRLDPFRWHFTVAPADVDRLYGKPFPVDHYP
jgi:hypothetical protein